MTFLPIVDRELRIAARRPATYHSRTLAAAVVMGVAGVIFLYNLTSFGLSDQGTVMFRVLSYLTLGFCIFEGVRKTADCLSRERREGTLGLLFLTDLRGYDVVLGKMVGASLASLYGLLAVLPILALPLLLGGVMPDEFWRLSLALVNMLFFSLSAGIWVSSRSWIERRAMFGTVCLVLSVILLPELLPGHLLAPLSPGHTFWQASTASYVIDAKGFWESVLFTQVISWLLLVWASVAVPRIKERSDLSSANTPEARRDTPVSAKSRARMLDANPASWLVSRAGSSRSTLSLVIVAVGIGTAIHLALQLSPAFAGMSTLLYVAAVLIINFIVKVRVAAESCHAMAEARRNNAWEMLLSSPISVEDIMEGQLMALKRMFYTPVAILLILEFIGGVGGLAIATRKEEGFIEQFFASLLPLSFYLFWSFMEMLAAVWMGMWQGLSSRNETQAVFRTVLYVLVLPLGMSVLWCFAWIAFMVWPIICLSQCQKKLRAEFRNLAGQRFAPETASTSWWKASPAEAIQPGLQLAQPPEQSN